MEQNNLPAPASAPQLPASRFAFAEGDDDFGEGRSGPGLKRYIKAVLRYKWLVLVFTVAGTALGVFLAGKVTLTYAAQGILWVQTVDRDSERSGPIRSTQLLRDNAWLELLESTAVLEPVVKDLRLYVRYAPADRDVMEGLRTDSVMHPGTYRLKVGPRGQHVELRTSQDVVVERVAVGEPLGSRLGLIWQPPASALRPDREVRFTVMDYTTAAIWLAEELRSAMPQRSNFLTVGYVDADPQRAAAVVNHVAETFVRVATDLKRVQLVEVRKILEEQMAFAEKNLESAEFQLNEFLVRTATLPSQPTSPVVPGTEATRADAMSSFFSLKSQRDQLMRDRMAIERAIGAGELSIDALSIVESAQRSPELSLALQELTQKRAQVRTLLQRYTNAHPQVIAANTEVTDLEQTVIPQLARNLMNELNTQIGVLDGQVNAAATELEEIPPRAISEAGYRRAMASAENIYNDLRQRFENARLAAETTQPDVSILTPAAVPLRPSSDTRQQVLMLGLVLGLGLGVGLAILLELMDRRVRYAEQVSDGMRLTLLGAVPDMSSRRMIFSASPDKAELVEALRGVRLNLTHAYGAAGPIMVTITSPGPGDGKTFLTANLGTSFADTGMRTLIIDADTRRGTLHHVMGVNRRPGLTDYLGQKISLEGIIRRSTVQNLDIIAGGSRHSNAPELLSSPLMGDLLAYIRSRYDVVLIDSPPLGAGVDPLVLGTATGNMMLIMRTGRTDRTLAEAKLAILDRLPVRILGAVLNGITTDTAYKYYSYLPGYEAGHEDEEDPGKLLQPA